jgi:hypothetical protein
MRKSTVLIGALLLMSSITLSQVTPLSPISIGSTDTQHKPMAKTWFYAGKWWAAIPPSVGGTRVFRLDGTTWVDIYTIASSGSRPDVWVQGDLVYILMYKGAGTNPISILQYDPATDKYKPWSQRPTPTNLTLPTGVEAATVTVDGTGRMWVAADGSTDIQVFYSDAPYNTWTSFTLATGVSTDDICTITKMPGKIGVFWSNQTTGLFGFRYHNDSDGPTVWSVTETPASGSVISGNPRMADDHMNIVAASDGKLYCVAKTSYNTTSLPQLILMIRSAAGVWENTYYPVTVGDGTQAIVNLNEVQSKIRIIYSSETNGGTILYKESSTSAISFGSALVLFTDSAPNYNFSSSTHHPYNPNVAVIATKQSTPRQIVSALINDGSSPDLTAPTVSSVLRSNPTTQNTSLTSVTYAVNFSEAVTGVDATDFTLNKTGTANGTIGAVSGSGTAYTVSVTGITGTGDLRLDVKSTGTGIIDAANNALSGGFITGEVYSVSPADLTAPTVSSVLRSNPTTQNTSLTSVTYAVNFSEPVNGVDASDFTLTTVSGSATGTIAVLLGACSNYFVRIDNITGTGTIRLELKNNGTGIVDAVGNSIPNGGYKEGDTYIITGVLTRVAPAIDSSVTLVMDPGKPITHKLVSVVAADKSLNPASGVKPLGITAKEKLTVEPDIKAEVFPNPFSGNTTFSFILKQESAYTITLYDTRGSRAITQYQGVGKAGITNNVKIEGSGLTSGLYLIDIKAGKNKKAFKVVKQ